MRTPTALALAILVVGGCRKSGDQRASGTDPGAALATVDGRNITRDRLEAHVRALPDSLRASYNSATGKRQLLDGLIQTEILVAEARRLGLDQEPEVIRATNQILVD